MKFPLEVLHELTYESEVDYNGGVLKVVQNEIVDRSRWSVWYDMVFSFKDKFYLLHYDVGATENQDSQTFSYNDEEIYCPEVVPIEIVTTKYEVLKKEKEYAPPFRAPSPPKGSGA